MEPGRDYRPVLAGVFWPSTALVWPWEEGPAPAAAGESPPDPAVREAVDSLAQVVPDDARERFYELAESPGLSREGEALELASLLAAAQPGGDEELGEDGAGADGADLLAAWAALDAELGAGPEIPTDPFDFGAPAGPAGAGPGAAAPLAGAGGPQAAGLLDVLNPRNLVRALTVRQMKDRAGTVGTRGVGPLLRDVQAAAPTARVHVIGHSYGARVLLNAVARPQGAPLPRPVDSMLLLQPAVNHLCFAPSLPGDAGSAGGYRSALDQVRLPILSTFSAHDFPLSKVFHLALCRAKDLGEIGIAGAGEPPSRFAALGGFGPRGEVPWRRTPTLLPAPGVAPRPEDFYDLGPGAPQVWALDGQGSISGHGDVTNATTAWALLNLVTAS